MKLQVLPFSFTTGLFTGTPLALLTLLLRFRNTPGTTISRLGSILPGYEFSVIGAIVGFGWLFLGGMIFGALVTLLYNAFLAEPANGLRPVSGDRPPKRARKPKREKLPKEPKPPKPEKLPKAAKPEKPEKPEKPAKPAKEKTPKIRTPKQSPAPKRHKTPYPGKVGSWKENSYGYGGYSNWSASA